MEFIGVSRDQVVTVDQNHTAFRVGTLGSFDDTELGTQIYLYFQAAGVIVDRGSVVITLSGEAALEITTALAAVAVGQGHQVGAAQAPMVAGDHGWMQVYGRGPVLTEADAAASTFLNTTDETGSLDDDGTALAIAVQGIILDAASAASAGVNESAHFNWPFAGLPLA